MTDACAPRHQAGVLATLRQGDAGDPRSVLGTVIHFLSDVVIFVFIAPCPRRVTSPRVDEGTFDPARGLSRREDFEWNARPVS